MKKDPTALSYVVYAIIRKQDDEGPCQYFLIEKQGYPTFPPTKIKKDEELYQALKRPLEEDLGLAADSYFLEAELEGLSHAANSIRYHGLRRQWQLYPVIISLTSEGYAHLLHHTSVKSQWKTLEEIIATAEEPNIKVISKYLQTQQEELAKYPLQPSMEGRACSWAATQSDAVRIVRGNDIKDIMSAGGRAFNLRVADPYLPYQKQGLGFTWSFFSPKDKQDLHVHGMPAVEIYGVVEGRLQLWTKQMNERGVRTWQWALLEPGDWAEVEPLTCHFACWLTPTGLGTVIKAAGSGELAGVGRIGISGKTKCDGCHMQGICRIPPVMRELLAIYQLDYEQRDFQHIAQLGMAPEI